MKFFRFIFLSLCILILPLQLQAEPEPMAALTSVNINSANVETLAEVLNGIGANKARAIIAYREAHGAFKTPDELVAVKGIGKSLVNKNRDRIRVK